MLKINLKVRYNCDLEEKCQFSKKLHLAVVAVTCQQGTSHQAEVGLKLLPSLKTYVCDICGNYHTIYIMTVP